MNEPLSESSVIALARRLRHPNASRLVKGIGDDCAVIRTPGVGVMLLTTDVMTEGVHFLPGQPPESIGAKLLAVNLSDIASMGGRPGEAVVAMMLPATTPVEWVERFYQGLGDVARRYAVNLVGGDVSRHPDRITLALTLTGRMRKDEVLYRSGAKAGDYLYVSGTLGDSDAGLALIKNEELKTKNRLVEKYLTPEPRVELGRLLARTHTVSACIDLSDGIAAGLRLLAEASRAAIEIDAEALPVSGELKAWCAGRSEDPVRFALNAGGDYELLFSVRQDSARRVERFGLKREGLPTLTRIGKVIEGKAGDITIGQGAGVEPLTVRGWEHFGGQVGNGLSPKGWTWS